MYSTRQRADQLVRQQGFPPPTAVLDGGRIWDTDDVIAWAQRKQRSVQLIMRVQAKRPGEDYWTAWAGSTPCQVSSLTDVQAAAEKHNCPAKLIRWADGSYKEMVDAGVAPPEQIESPDVV